MDLKPLRVRELNHYISKIVSNDPLLYNIVVEGEVSNCKYHSNGHIYFTLKDDKSRVRCIMFVNNAADLDFTIEEGAKVTVRGSVNVYERDGSYQINVKKVRQSGRGELYAQFEELKEKLFLEGLFDEGKKKEIPKYPRKIGLVTSITGSTVKDMIINIRRRNDTVAILVAPTLVQGSGSKEDIVRSIEALNQRDDIDTIIVGRGGGSIEELWSFNEEEVARAIYHSKIPIVSAVGHETDFTIADLVADIRASTPSVAAEISVVPISEIKEGLDKLYSQMLRLQSYRLSDERSRLERSRERLVLQSPMGQIDTCRESSYRELVRLKDSMEKVLVKRASKLSELAHRLDDLSPLTTLNRGYAFVKDDRDNLISSIGQVSKGKRIKIQFRDGEAISKVESLSTGGGEDDEKEESSI